MQELRQSRGDEKERVMTLESAGDDRNYTRRLQHSVVEIHRPASFQLLQGCSGGHRTHLFWNLLSREQIVSFNRFCAVPVPFSIGRPGKRGLLRSIPSGYVCQCLQLS